MERLHPKRSSWRRAVVLAGVGVAAVAASCGQIVEDSSSSGGGLGGAGASSASTASGDSGEGSWGGELMGLPCAAVCSNDLKAIIDECTGQLLQSCTADQGCVNHACVDSPCLAAEESRSSYGCDYWALKTAQRPQADGACFAAVIVNSWEKPVHLQVTRDSQLLPVDTFAFIPDANADPGAWPAYDPTKGIDVGQAAILFLSRGPGGLSDCPRPAALDVETGVKGTGIGSAFHITTDYPVTAYQISPYGAANNAYGSATLLIPASAWSTQYMAINGFMASPDPLKEAIPSLSIVAEKDGTQVTITPSADIVPGPSVEGTAKGVAKTYSLDAGQFLQITQPEELTGSAIESNDGYPIALFGASTCMFVPDDAQADCNPGQQQIAPFFALGNEYVAVGHKSRIATEEPHLWRLVGATDGTVFQWKPERPPGAPAELNAGEVVAFMSSEPFTVKSQDHQHAFYLGGYMTGGAPFADIGGSAWVNVTPSSQYLNTYIFFTDPTYPETSLTVIRRPSLDPHATTKFADVELECLGKLDGWQPIGNFEYTRVDLVTGDFKGNGKCANGRQKMTSALPFGVTVWGWGTTPEIRRVSYAYPAGEGFVPIHSGIPDPTH